LAKITLIIALLLVIPDSLAKKSLPQLKLGEIPPSALGVDSDGNKINLDDLKGKLVIITFWASWCPPCLKELPYLETIQTKLGLDKIKVIAINYKESRKKYWHIRKRLSDLTLTLTHDKKGYLAKKYGVNTLPNLFIIGKDGKLAYHAVGYGDHSIKKIIKIINQQLLINTSS